MDLSLVFQLLELGEVRCILSLVKIMIDHPEQPHVIPIVRITQLSLVINRLKLCLEILLRVLHQKELTDQKDIQNEHQ